MAYYLGVDLGTTFTAAAVWRGGRVDIATLGNRAPTIPSVVLLRDDGSLLVGEAAERRAAVEPRRVARQYKRRFGDPTPIVVGGTPYSADGLTATMLRRVVDRVTETEGRPPSGIAVSYPANWGAYKTDLLGQAIARADLDRVATVTEPEAAAIHYASQERVEPGSVIAVYDLGGGTFDAAVLRKTDTGWDTLGQPQGVERLGGIDIDEAVFQHVIASLGGADDDPDPDDATALSAMARLRADCVDAKEALSSDTDVSIPVLLPNVQTEIRLTRRELENMIRPALEGSITALDRALRTAGVRTAEVSTVLLVGGSSRFPLVSELVSSELGRPVAVDAHPKYSIALGAAVVAAGRDVADAENRSEIAAAPEEPPAPPSAPAPPAPAPAPTVGGYHPAPSAAYPYGYAPPPGPATAGTTASRTTLWITLGGILSVALMAVLVAAFSGDGDGDEPAAPPATTTSSRADDTTSTTTTTPSRGTGVSDAEMQEMEDSCEAGAMRDCDALWMLSPVDSDFEALAMSCGGRDSSGEHTGTCHDDFPEATAVQITLSHTALGTLRSACEHGYNNYCDMLYWRTPLGSDLEAYAQSCGGRATDGQTYSGLCHETFGNQIGTAPTT